MGKKKSKTQKQKHAKAIASSSKRTSKAKSPLSSSFGVKVQKGATGKGGRDRILTDGGSHPSLRSIQQNKKKHPKSSDASKDKAQPHLDDQMNIDTEENKNSNKNKKRKTLKKGWVKTAPQRTTTTTTFDQKVDFHREYESLKEREFQNQNQTNSKKQNKNLFTSLASPTLNLGPKTPDEMLHETTKQMPTAMASIGKSIISVQQQHQQPSNVLQLMAEQIRQKNEMEETTINETDKLKNNFYAVLPSGDSDDDDEKKDANVPLFQFAPPTFQLQRAHGDVIVDDDPDL